MLVGWGAGRLEGWRAGWLDGWVAGGREGWRAGGLGFGFGAIRLAANLCRALATAAAAGHALVHFVVQLHAHVEHPAGAACVALVRPRRVARVAVLGALLARAGLRSGAVERVAARAHVAVSGAGAGACAAVRAAAAALLLLGECEARPADLTRRLVVAALAASDGAAGRLAPTAALTGAAALSGATGGQQREEEEGGEAAPHGLGLCVPKGPPVCKMATRLLRVGREGDEFWGISRKGRRTA